MRQLKLKLGRLMTRKKMRNIMMTNMMKKMMEKGKSRMKVLNINKNKKQEKIISMRVPRRGSEREIKHKMMTKKNLLRRMDRGIREHLIREKIKNDSNFI